MPDACSEDSKKDAISSLVFRPPQTLQNLPLKYRWEVTRRHPYYLQCWDMAHRLHAGTLSSPQEQAYGKFAVSVLQGIGMTGDPPPPSAGEDELEHNQLGAAWAGGAIAPLTLRAFASVLLQDLPSETRAAIGRLLLESTDNPDDEQSRKYDVLTDLSCRSDSGLDSFPSRPVIGINIYASTRAIQEAIELQVREWKKSEGIPETRRRDPLLPQYIKVWDLREGWQTDHYDIAQEKSFIAIAIKLKMPVKTAVNRHKSAFQLICGHPHQFETWMRLFAKAKLASLSGNKSLRRRRVSQSRRSAVTVEDTVEMVTSHTASSNIEDLIGFDGETEDLLMQIKLLLSSKLTDAEIVQRLGLSNEAKQAIAYLRGRESHRT